MESDMQQLIFVLLTVNISKFLRNEQSETNHKHKPLGP